jgi:hypothetical protein
MWLIIPKVAKNIVRQFFASVMFLSVGWSYQTIITELQRFGDDKRN